MMDWSQTPRANAEAPGGKFSFVLLPRFSLLALAGAVEPLRHANHVLGRNHYEWPMFSEDGAAICSSSGIEVRPAGCLADVPLDSNVILVGGADILSYSSAQMVRWLRKAVLRAPLVGGLCTATRVLADAGLLDGHKATIHWEMAESFRETFPAIDLTGSLFEIDRNRLTCAGEAASTDMMLNMLAGVHGKALASAVAAQVLHGRVRSPVEAQAPVALRTGTRNKYVLRAIALMESSHDEPFDIEVIAERAGCSRRHLERLFKEKTGMAPVHYYRNARLDRARQLLVETNMSFMEVAIASGFESSGTFSTAYKRRFGLTPTMEERVGCNALPQRVHGKMPAFQPGIG
jgi:AraC family transcriptional regulator, glycine betaine-responsive activator